MSARLVQIGLRRNCTSEVESRKRLVFLRQMSFNTADLRPDCRASGRQSLLFLHEANDGGIRRNRKSLEIDR